MGRWGKAYLPDRNCAMLPWPVLGGSPQIVSFRAAWCVFMWLLRLPAPELGTYDELLAGAVAPWLVPAAEVPARTFRVLASKIVHATHLPNAKAEIGRPGLASLTFVVIQTSIQSFFLLQLQIPIRFIHGFQSWRLHCDL
jgi:hypothetical protein